MCPQVFLQRVGLSELATTEFTAILPRATVDQLVTSDVRQSGKVLPAFLATVLEHVLALEVDPESPGIPEMTSTVAAYEQPASLGWRGFRLNILGAHSVPVIGQLDWVADNVLKHMQAEEMWIVVCFLALQTLILLNVGMLQHVRVDPSLAVEVAATATAHERTLPEMPKTMHPKPKTGRKPVLADVADIAHLGTVIGVFAMLIEVCESRETTAADSACIVCECLVGMRD